MQIDRRRKTLLVHKNGVRKIRTDREPFFFCTWNKFICFLFNLRNNIHTKFSVSFPRCSNSGNNRNRQKILKQRKHWMCHTFCLLQFLFWIEAERVHSVVTHTDDTHALFSSILCSFFFGFVFVVLYTTRRSTKKNMFWLITSHQAVDGKRKSKYTFHTLHISFTFPQATFSSYIFLVFHFGFVANVHIHHVHVLCLHSTRTSYTCACCVVSMCLCSQHST